MAALTISARKISDLATHKTACLVLPLTDDNTLGSPAAEVDAALDGAITKVIALGDFDGKLGSTTWLLGNEVIKRVLLVGVTGADSSAKAGEKISSAIAQQLTKSKATSATIAIGFSDHWSSSETQLNILARELVSAAYRYTETKSTKPTPPSLKKVICSIGGDLSLTQANAAIRVGNATGLGANAAKELGNLPANICTPRYLSAQAKELAQRYSSIKVTVLDEKKMAALGMGSLLSVGHGSDEPSQLITIEHKGAGAKDAPYALVGKGITFDTGGISLKPGPKMDEMKFDMGGAAAVFGTLVAVAELQLPINVVGVIAAAENMPSGRATKPGDVVTSMSGKTIEILNTDAEGRLVLCDALTYVGKFKPAEVVDIATLTGAIIVSLGNHATGIFANDDNLAQALTEAGETIHDRGWRMPLWDDYQKQLDSNFADMANIGTGTAGSVVAACFLARFTEDYKWAHLDVAGTSFGSSPKGATGRPVPMLVEYLRQRAAK
jgi:leucyl aminopeptidase